MSNKTISGHTHEMLYRIYILIEQENSSYRKQVNKMSPVIIIIFILFLNLSMEKIL